MALLQTHDKLAFGVSGSTGEDLILRVDDDGSGRGILRAKML